MRPTGTTPHSGQPIYGLSSAGLAYPVKIDEEDNVGALAVNIQDQHTRPLFLPFHYHLGAVTLAVPASGGDRTVDLVAGHGCAVGELLSLREGKAFYDGEIRGVAGNTISLGLPIDRAYSVSAQAWRGLISLDEDGSGAPIVTHVSPPPFLDFDIYGIRLVLGCAGQPDDSKFGDLGALQYGIVLRKFCASTGNYTNMGAARRNGDMALFTGQVEYTDKAGGGAYAVRIVADFAIHWGVSVRLFGANGDELQFLVQDDLTGLLEFNALAVGHVVQP